MARRRASSSSGAGLVALLAVAVLIKYYWLLLPLVAVVLVAAVIHVVFFKDRTSASLSCRAASVTTTTRSAVSDGNCPELPGVEWHFHTKVVGVSFNNSDGQSRQRIIGKCSVGEHVYLAPEPDNPYDHDAILVCRSNGEQLGHLNRELAHDIMNRGELGSLVAQISDLTGGTWGKPTRGVNLRIGKRTAQHESP